ncbi:precorrin-4 C(11)-methyltransferase [Carboxylicivirga mesophila]|uniref:Precorrin-4 C(11)-methyltransferase n=1 Tax=Carboxylicivirga mesophila TaxID=1166478 RepID=A0ABS5K9R4_9BACT|nr:precorrin-4 C(11)-methyltransferase [Carboxylicivirga mesophila]MBS2211764.1 precorrin-4 C(11)-methyltransferase [Carboxylicivirga mesophila]
MNKTAIIVNNRHALPLANTLQQELDAVIYSTSGYDGTQAIESLSGFIVAHFNELDSLIFIGALGITVRSVAPVLGSKQTDPAVLNIDIHGRFVQPVVSGHKGGANELAKRVARITGGQAIVTTASDSLELWPLDIIGNNFGWTNEYLGLSENEFIASFVNGASTALVLETKDAGTLHLENTLPDHVTLFHHFSEVDESQFELIIAVSPYISEIDIPCLFFRPKCLVLGAGSQKGLCSEYFNKAICTILEEEGLSCASVKALHTIDIKKDEQAFIDVAQQRNISLVTHTASDLNRVADKLKISEAALNATGASNVSEAAALLGSGNLNLLLEKTKGCDEAGKHFTLAIAMDLAQERRGQVVIVGAGPGDPELVSVKGKRLLQAADLILYAGSLVPEQLTHYAKEGCVVRNSAQMDLEEQFDTMKETYDKGGLVVRLHTGDPCIYGAIQEQMNFFDQHNMPYEIVPGISSFQAAAARLQSQFTIPERIQTIILTRGEGRTPMPPREKLSELAKFQSTICLFLSVSLIDEMQRQLLEGYPPETPVAVCYKLTWKEEKIWRGQLMDLAKIVKENNLTLTVMIVVGEAIDNRDNRSRLYDRKFTHLFRQGKDA